MINIPKGTRDVLPSDSHKWQYIEREAAHVAAAFGAREIRTPVFEHTELFLRGVGETTDIVSKEMYTFLDKAERSITLKPEGTAGVARSFVENNMDAGGLPVKLYYFTQAYRYENVQHGRLREHHQFGVEFFGSQRPEADAEVISLAYTLLNRLGVKELALNINSIGCAECRKAYNAALKAYLSDYIGHMCGDCKRRIDKNPLRILDCKEEFCRNVNSKAPVILDYLCGECGAHMESLKEILTALEISYSVNPYIVRGLDYYNRTVFEFVTTALGAQGTVCAGGRYDGLISGIGGKEMPAAGFGMGIERLLLLLEATGASAGEPEGIDLFIASFDKPTTLKAAQLSFALRKQGIRCEYELLGRSVKAQFKYADRIRAKYVLVIGGNELSAGSANIKRMADGTQIQTALDADSITAVLGMGTNG